MLRKILFSAALLLLGSAAGVSLVAGEFKVVAQTELSEPTLHDWILMENPDGSGDLLIMTFRRDGFILVVDLVTGEIRQHFLQGLGWSLRAGVDGKVYIGTSLSPGARLYAYDPLTDQIEEVAHASGENIIYWIDSDGEGNLYMGTYPNAKLYRYDVFKGVFEDLGSLDDEQTYNAFGRVGPNGKVYAGLGMKAQTLIEYDPATGEKKSIWPKDWETPHAPRIYRGIDGNLYIYPAVTTPASEGKLLKVTEEGVSVIEGRGAPQDMGRNPRRAHGRPALSDGRCLQNVGVDHLILIATDESGNVSEERLDLKYEGAVKPIFSIGLGPENIIYASSKPAVLMSFNPATEEVVQLKEKSPSGAQVYRKVAHNNKLYMSTYTHAHLHVYDPSKPDVGSVDLGVIGAQQDRPIDMKGDSKGNLWIVSWPGYGLTGGALSLYREDQMFRNWRHIIPEQSINALAVSPDESCLYLGSSIYAGSGGNHYEGNAVVARWDVDLEKVTASTEVPDAKTITGLVALPNGMVVATTQDGRLFVLNGSDLKIISTVNLPGPTNSFGQIIWDDNRQKVFGVAESVLWSFSPESINTIQVEGQWDSPIDYGLIADETGAFYFGSGRDLVQWKP